MLFRLAIPALFLAACQPASEPEQSASSPASVVQPARAADPEAARDIETVDGFADIFELPRLSDGAPDELRLWSEEYLFGNIQGTIIKPDGITVFFIQDDEPGRSPRSAWRETPKPSPVLERLGELAAWKGRHWICPNVMDGAGLFVDGVSGGKRFTFSQINTHHCYAEVEARLNDVLSAIGDVPRIP